MPFRERAPFAEKLPAEILGRCREQVMRKLNALSSALSAAISATINSRVEVVTEAAEIAVALRDHWGPTFAHQRINRATLQQWLREDAENPRG